MMVVMTCYDYHHLCCNTITIVIAIAFTAMYGDMHHLEVFHKLWNVFDDLFRDVHISFSSFLQRDGGMGGDGGFENAFLFRIEENADMCKNHAKRASHDPAHLTKTCSVLNTSNISNAQYRISKKLLARRGELYRNP